MGLICKRLLSHQGRRQQQQQQVSSPDLKSKNINPSSSTATSSSTSSPTSFAMPRFLPSLASKKSSTSSSSAVPSLQSINTNSTVYYENSQLTPIELKDEFYNNTSVGTPTVPFGWEVRFDPTLGEYYYLNQINNLIQLDHPEEVLSPITRHVSLDSIFINVKEDESDSNFKLSKYGDEKITNAYTDVALNHHYLLANGTGIPPQQQLKKSWKERLSLIKTRSISRSSSPTLQQQLQQQQQQVLQQQRFVTVPQGFVDNNDTSSLISVSSSDTSIDDRTAAENIFYGMSQQQPHPPQEQMEDDDEEEEIYDQDQLELMRMRMLMELKSCEMQKLATV